MSTVPRALRRARRWTAGLLTASTVLVGAVGIHLAQTQGQTVATQNVSQSSSQTTGQTSGQDVGGSGSIDDSGSSSSGFGAVAPVGGSDAQAQTSSGGS